VTSPRESRASASASETAAEMVRLARAVCRELRPLSFGGPVTHVYDPLEYARASHEAYLRKFATGRKEVLLVGMNPGPFGMAQTGVPFGEVTLVRDWLGIEEPVGAPANEHPKREIKGFACTRSEVSGRRLWSWCRDRFGTPRAFFRRFFVHNYCPLAFMAASGSNVTPDKLAAGERRALFAICDRYLAGVVAVLRPRIVVGIGAFATERARAALGDAGVAVGRMPHPSPASPAANRGWAEAADEALAALGIEVEGG